MYLLGYTDQKSIAGNIQLNGLLTQNYFTLRTVYINWCVKRVCVAFQAFGWHNVQLTTQQQQQKRIFTNLTNKWGVSFNAAVLWISGVVNVYEQLSGFVLITTLLSNRWILEDKKKSKIILSKRTALLVYAHTSPHRTVFGLFEFHLLKVHLFRRHIACVSIG